MLITDKWTYADYQISLGAKFQCNQWNRAKMGIFTSSEKTVLLTNHNILKGILIEEHKNKKALPK